MPSFVPYLDEVIITGFVRDFDPHAFDIASFMDDPTAAGVMIRVAEDTQVLTTIAVYGNSYSFLPNRTLLVPSQQYLYAVGLEGGTTITIAAADLGTEVSIYLVGELHGPDLVMLDAPVYYESVLEPFDVWIERTVTTVGGDVPSDVAAVIIGIYERGGGQIGVRKNGSTDVPFDVDNARAHFDWTVCGVDPAGKYETWVNGKDTPPAGRSCDFIDIGYILKTGGVVTIDEPGDDPLNVAVQYPAFGTLDLSNKVSSSAFLAGGRWENFPATSDSHNLAREIGSVSGAGGDTESLRTSTLLTNVTNLNAAKECEYISQRTGVDFLVTFYEHIPPPAAPALPTPGPLHADIRTNTGTSIKGIKLSSSVTTEGIKTRANVTAKDVTTRIRLSYKEIRTFTSLSTEGINVQ